MKVSGQTGVGAAIAVPLVLALGAAQLAAAKDHAELQALIIKENSATRELMRGDALAAANAKIIQLETINALADKGHR